MPDRLTEAAPAKVNLYLHLTGRRDDGYHLLDSLVAFAEIGDVLRAEPAETLSLRVAGPFAGGVSAESDNLVLRAARALATEAGVSRRGYFAGEAPARGIRYRWRLGRRGRGAAAAVPIVGAVA